MMRSYHPQQHQSITLQHADRQEQEQITLPKENRARAQSSASEAGGNRDVGIGANQKQVPHADGFYTKEAKRAQSKKAKVRQRLETEKETDSKLSAAQGGKQDQPGDVTDAGNNQRQIAGKAGHPNMGASQKGAAMTAKPTVRGSKRYDQFQRSEAMGQFGELAYPNCDEDNHDEMEVDEDAASSDADAEHQLGANAEHEREDAPYVFTGVKLHPMIAQSEQAEGGTDEEMKETAPKGP
ncbi:hypothetical protein PRIC2_014001 [Phytophthora ramorum]